jgi:hypothetical protein
LKKKGINKSYCKGCRPEGKQCAILKKRCTLLLNNEVHFCYECKDFPCKNLQHIDKRYQKFYRMSFIENLLAIQKNGVNRFFSEQKKKWRCPTCGGLICCHNGLCFHCDVETLKTKKKRYRWGDE